jgi:hypothetical protein
MKPALLLPLLWNAVLMSIGIIVAVLVYLMVPSIPQFSLGVFVFVAVIFGALSVYDVLIFLVFTYVISESGVAVSMNGNRVFAFSISIIAVEVDRFWPFDVGNIVLYMPNGGTIRLRNVSRPYDVAGMIKHAAMEPLLKV